MTPTAQEIEALARRLCWNAGHNPDQVVHGAYSSHAEPPCVQTPSGRAFLCFNPEPLWKSWMAVANSALKFMGEGELSSVEEPVEVKPPVQNDGEAISKITHEGSFAFVEFIDIPQAVGHLLNGFFPVRVIGEPSHTSEYGIKYMTFDYGWKVAEAKDAKAWASTIAPAIEEWAKKQQDMGHDVLVWRTLPRQEFFPDEGIARIRWRCHTMEKKDMQK